jgi:hypothetical protein
MRHTPGTMQPDDRKDGGLLRDHTAPRETHDGASFQGGGSRRVSFRADLDMPGMLMGANVVRLTATSPGTFEGRGLIVRCMSRRTDWRATVCLPGIGDAQFFFNVVSK